MLAAKAEVNFQSRLDPRAYRLISKLAFAGDVDSLDPVLARRAYNFSRRQYTWPLDEVGEITEFPASLDGTPALKLFRPRNAAAEGLETYIFLHGGGWTLGDLSTYEPLCRRLANELGANVLWVEYRLAPEHPFPAALDDAVAAVHWVSKHGAELGLDPERISLIGDSAGGNIAAVLALLNRRAEYGPKFLRQVLIYPCVDLTASGTGAIISAIMCRSTGASRRSSRPASKRRRLLSFSEPVSIRCVTMRQPMDSG
jgi:acetyl esterase